MFYLWFVEHMFLVPEKDTINDYNINFYHKISNITSGRKMAWAGNYFL